MKFQCDNCGREATVHQTEISGGEMVERHLCQECAASEGVTIKAQMPISQLLEEMVLQSAAGKDLSELRCEVCGITFLEFRRDGLLGCPNDYLAFEDVLEPLLERAHDGATLHSGKIPADAADLEQKQNQLLRLRGRLKDAVAGEDYELAARIRDEIKELERS